jgi:hypothetical protein
MQVMQLPLHVISNEFAGRSTEAPLDGFTVAVGSALEVSHTMIIFVRGASSEETGFLPHGYSKAVFLMA